MLIAETAVATSTPVEGIKRPAFEMHFIFIRFMFDLFLYYSSVCYLVRSYYYSAVFQYVIIHIFSVSSRPIDSLTPGPGLDFGDLKFEGANRLTVSTQHFVCWVLGILIFLMQHFVCWVLRILIFLGGKNSPLKPSG